MFESHRITDQRQAIALCDACPARDWCEEQRLETVSEFGVAVGVWAGKAYAERDYRVPAA